MTLIEKARALATVAHEGQVRKVDKSPYIDHPRAVAQIVQDAGGSEIAVAAAYVHDVLEDTAVTEEQLRAELGDEVVHTVRALTEDKSLAWEERKQKYCDVVRNAPRDAQLVSLADKIHNARCVIEGHGLLGEAVWSEFNRGKDQKLWFEREMLKVFQEKLDTPLVTEYESLIGQMDALV